MAAPGNGPFGVDGFEKRLRDITAEYTGGAAKKARPHSRLKEIEGFGANPGHLTMLAYVPPNLPAGAPLVVVLHGCTQDARGYDASAGWSALAESEGFAVLYPEQQRGNNPQKCFNWFLPADAARGLGEARSIHEMIEHLVRKRRLNAGRVYVVGLSAGGAMAAALLGDYPEMFAGGAVIAGLHCGAATSVNEAFEAMSRPRELSAERLGDFVRAGSPHEGPWPTISIWHGDRDATVAPRNADALVRQWLNVHGLDEDGFEETRVDGHRRRVWRAEGRPVVESYTIAGMGHGTPLDGRQGERRAPFMLDVGVSSTRRIAAFWGIAAPDAWTAETSAAKPKAEQPKAEQAGTERPKAGRPERPAAEPEILGPSDPDSWSSVEQPRRTERAGDAGWGAGRVSVGEVINRALRAAGLMR